MNENIIEMIEPTPKLETKKCKLLALGIKLFLQFFTYISSLIVLYMYDYIFGIMTFFVSYVVVGIIRAKLRNSSIPVAQQEYNYNDDAIAKWYTKKEFCYHI